jgi:uncharacterized RDD family membrane protein YckC
MTIGLFLLWNGYFIFFEMRGGTTPGKNTNNYKVMREDGTALTPSSVYIRNLMREVEIWMPIRFFFVAVSSFDEGFIQLVPFLWIFIFAIFPHIDRKNRRLGDLLAGTVVVRMPTYRLEVDLTVKQKSGSDDVQIVFTPEMMNIYGKKELQVLEDVLRRQESLNYSDRSRLIAKVVKKIARKIGYKEEILPKDRLLFLQTFYDAQRKRLESKLVRGQSLKRNTRKLVNKITTRRKRK